MGDTWPEPEEVTGNSGISTSQAWLQLPENQLMDLAPGTLHSIFEHAGMKK